MAEFQRTQAQVDVALESRRMGSQTMIIGWIILGMAALVGIYVFSAVRDGDLTWPTYVGIMFVIGLGLVLGGAFIRSRGR